MTEVVFLYVVDNTLLKGPHRQHGRRAQAHNHLLRTSAYPEEFHPRGRGPLKEAEAVLNNFGNSQEMVKIDFIKKEINNVTAANPF